MNLTRRKRTFILLAFLALLAVAVCGTAMGAADGAESSGGFYATVWSLLPPVAAIGLALITKEVYISLFIGILVGALFYSNFNIEALINSIFYVQDAEGAYTGGMVSKLVDDWNVGILIFLVILGILVALINKAGGSAAYGRWASNKIKTKRGALLSTFGLGALIFVDDYFNCLTVGSVMLPVTDKHKISRAKLAYIIDATAAPICIIAPISSWAAAVTSSVPDGSTIDGFQMFLRSIPYNFYALLTIAMLITLSVLKFDFGPMKKHEKNAEKGDLFTTDSKPFENEAREKVSSKGKVIDLVLPIVILIVSCVLGMVYTGGFFSGTDFITAFADCNAAKGLVLGSFITLVVTFLFYIPRRVISFKEFASAIPAGFKAMVPAILILIFAWTLSSFTNLLGAPEFVEGLVRDNATASAFLPAILFLVALGLAFATGTSWGTFAILVPIVVGVFPQMSEILVIAISAVLAGAVCGDHCSPISDTTIMASTGAQCDHINHVSTQLPYALVVAAVSFVFFIIAGFVQNWLIVMPIAIVVMVLVLFVIKRISVGRKPNISETAVK